MAPIVAIIFVVAGCGTAALLVTSRRLRDEITALLRSFDDVQRSLVPVVVTVRSDRDRLHERLAALTDPGSEAAGVHR